MKALAPAILTALAGPACRRCRLIKVTTLAGVVYALTDLDVAVTYAGDLYRADIGIELTSIAVASGTDQSSVDISLLLSSDTRIYGAAPDRITRDKLVHGLLDNASVSISILADWSNPGVGAVLYYAGRVRKITFNDDSEATLSIASILDPNLNCCFALYSTTCRADLGDSKCKVDVTSKSKVLTVASVSNRQVFATNLTDANGYWQDGVLKFTSGVNNGFPVEVGAYSKAGGGILTKLPLPYMPAVGDTAIIYPGCDKTVTTCNDKYNNMPNFRGEPVGIQPTAIVARLLPPTIQVPPAAPTPPASAASTVGLGGA